MPALRGGPLATPRPCRRGRPRPCRRCRPRAGCGSSPSLSRSRRSPRAARPGRSARRLPAAAVHARRGSALAAVSRLDGQGPGAQDRLPPRPVRRRLGERRRLRHARPDPRARPAREELPQRDARCVVLSGRLADPYTSTTIAFARGGASEVDIDHVVALGDAWQKGAWRWPHARARGLRQRSAEPARRRRIGQPPEGRRRHGDLAAGQQELPLRLRGAPGLGQAQVRALGHGRRARRDAPRARPVPDSSA